MARPSNPGSKNSVAMKVEGLSCVKEVDSMLMEEASIADVVAFIQVDQELLENVNPRTLGNVLLARRKLKMDEAEEFERNHWSSDSDSPPPDSEMLWREKPKLPSTFTRMAYERTKGGIEEINELEGLYLGHRHRLERLLDLEHRAGVFSENTSKEFLACASILMDRLKARKELGLVGRQGGDLHLHLDVGAYSERTVEVLQNPEKRHRVVNLLERLGRLKELPTDVIDIDPES